MMTMEEIKARAEEIKNDRARVDENYRKGVIDDELYIEFCNDIAIDKDNLMEEIENELFAD